MAIEVTEVKGAPKFPRAYRSKTYGYVVLAFTSTRGVVITGSAYQKVTGEPDNWSTGFSADCWEPVNLSITHD